MPFRNPDSMLNKTNIIEIIEDNDLVFEIKITECLAEKVFREENACDIGFAAVCFADYSLPQAFNPKIKLIRDKTVMQDHKFCNHKYTISE